MTDRRHLGDAPPNGEAWAIRAVGLGKCYRLRDRQRRLADVGRRVDQRTIDAVSDLTVEIPRGEITGVIGTNGSGKSTLLRLIAGVTTPTSGSVEVRGTVRGLLELGDNFNALLTGEENAIGDLRIEGLGRREAIDLLPSIADFAGLGGRLDQPLRSFSSGMRLRLAFATATALPADIVLIDELLAVGDGPFQDKCIRRLGELRDAGATIVLTSHSIDHVTQLCDTAIWMVDGRCKEVGDAREVADHYNGLIHTTAGATDGGHDTTASVRLASVEVCHARGGQARTITPGAAVDVHIDYEVIEDVAPSIIEVSIQAEGADQALIEANTESDEFPLPREPGTHSVAIRWDRLDLSGGTYHVHVGVYSADWRTTHTYAWAAATLIVSGEQAPARMAPPRTWSAT